MNKLIRNNLLSICVVVAIALCAAWIPNQKVIDSVAYDLSVTNELAVPGALNATGATTVNEFIFTAGAVSLTSPTVTFSADGLSYITLNSDANQTGVNPVGGVAGQTIIVVAGAGSNTMQFDDNSTTLSLGGNIVLTEGTGDNLSLLCVTAPNVWTRTSEAQN